MKFKSLTLVFLIIGFSLSADAQLDKTSQKNIKKANKYSKKKKYEESANYVKAVLQINPLNEKLWKYYQDIWYKNYEENYKPMPNFTIESENDSLAILLRKAVMYVMEKPKWDYLNAVNDASMYSPYNAESSIIMRNYYIDRKLDMQAKVNGKSMAYFEKAEGEFSAKNYERAIGYYQKAIEEDSTNYKAVLYLGDSYYAMEYYGKAAEYFRKAMEMRPGLLEPVKYLADALDNKGEREQALDVLKQSLLIYPEEGMFIKIYNVLEDIGTSKLDRNWVLRKATIAKTVNESRRENFFEDMTYFSFYDAAGEEAKESYDTNGIAINASNPNQYLEVHCWKKMLENTKPEDTPELDYAREMEEKGLLTPYVLINLFNVDLYSQYKHYVTNNKSTVERYINDYLIVQRTDSDDED